MLIPFSLPETALRVKAVKVFSQQLLVQVRQCSWTIKTHIAYKAINLSFCTHCLIQGMSGDVATVPVCIIDMACRKKKEEETLKPSTIH